MVDFHFCSSTEKLQTQFLFGGWAELAWVYLNISNEMKIQISF